MLHPTRSPANWPLLSVSNRIDAEARSLQTVKWTALLKAIRLRLQRNQISGRISGASIGAALELAGFGTRNAQDWREIARVLRVGRASDLDPSDIATLVRDEPVSVDYETVSAALQSAIGVYIDRINEEARRCDAVVAMWRSPARRVHLGLADRSVLWSVAAAEPRFREWDWARVTIAFAALERTASELLACLVVFVALTNTARAGLKKEPAAAAASAGAGAARVVAGGESAVASSTNAASAGAQSSSILNKFYGLTARSMATVDKTVDRIRLPLFSRTPSEAE